MTIIIDRLLVKARLRRNSLQIQMLIESKQLQSKMAVVAVGRRATALRVTCSWWKEVIVTAWQ